MNTARNIVYLAAILAAAASSLEAGSSSETALCRIEQNTFVIRGVAYSNAPIGQPFNSQPSATCPYARDLPLIAALGANTVRTYAMIPAGDTVFLNVLASSNLYWLAGFPLDQFYDPTAPSPPRRPRSSRPLARTRASSPASSASSLTFSETRSPSTTTPSSRDRRPISTAC